MSDDADTSASTNAESGTAGSDPETAGPAFPGPRYERVVALAGREFTTLVRTRAYVALAVVYWLVVFGLATVGGVGGYLPLVLDLRTPAEVLVPVLAFAFGTWTVLADAVSGELDVLRTYPVDRVTYVGGAYLGRAVGLLAVVLLPLVVLGLVVPTAGGGPATFLATHGTVDSPVYFGRFLALTAWYALVALALAMAVSSLARSRWTGLALAVVAVLVVVVGLDLLVVVGVARGTVGPGILDVVLGLSPPGAYRGLVLETATGGLYETGPPAGNVAVSVAGLLAWPALALGVAVLGAWSPGGD